MPEQQRRADVAWEGDLSGLGTLWGSSGALRQLLLNWVSRTQSTGGWTSPEELQCAAVASSYSMALADQLARADTPAQRFDVSATADVEVEDQRVRITGIKLTVLGNAPGLSDESFAAAAEAALTACPIASGLQSTTPISVETQLRSYRVAATRPAASG